MPWSKDRGWPGRLRPDADRFLTDDGLRDNYQTAFPRGQRSKSRVRAGCRNQECQNTESQNFPDQLGSLQLPNRMGL